MIISKKYFILLVLASYYFIGLYYGASPVTGDIGTIQTNISVWPGEHYYLEGQEALLEGSVWDTNGQPVETGELHVTDLNGSTSFTTSVTGKLTPVNWTVTVDGLPGIHVFEIVYNDPDNNYLSCTSYQKLLIGKIIGEGETEMAITMDYPAFNVAKGQQAEMTGSLTSLDTVFPYFYIDQETAWISIEANIEGNWKILAVSYPSIGITASYEFEVPVVLPFWVITGPVSARCAFSGSLETDLAITEVQFTINVLPAEKSLVLFSQQSEVERNNLTEQNTLLLEVQVPGFDSDPVTLDLDLLATDGSLVKQLIADQALTGYSNQLSISISREIAVGDYNLSATLVDASTGVPLATDSLPVTVVDELLVDNFYWDIDEHDAYPGQQVSGYLVTREEDTFTGVSSRLTMVSSESGTILFNNTTGVDGYVDFSFTLPVDLPAGINIVNFELSPLQGDNYHLETSKLREIVIKKNTSILHQESQLLVRGQEGQFNATAIDDLGLPVATGSLSLELNGELIYESTNPSTACTYTVPAMVPKGINIFTWQYTGSNILRDSTVSFPLAVYSTPVFNNLSIDSLETFPGEEISLTGQLVEETGITIAGAEITVTHRDNWGKVSQYSVLTDENGHFTFLQVLENESTGTHSFTLEFVGWAAEYYLPVEGKPFFEVSVIPKVSLIVDNQLVAGDNATLEFHGKPDQEIVLEILENGTWLELAIFDLDANGVRVYEWTIPGHLKGENLIRAGYSDSQEKVIFTLTIHVKPIIDIQVTSSPVLTGEKVEILVSSSEKYTILLDGKTWQDNQAPGSSLFTLVFSDPGDHVVEVKSSGIYIVETVKTVNIQVREDYSVSIDIPARAQRAVDIPVKTTIMSNQSQPLEGFSIELYINGTIMGTAITSQAGIALMTLNLNVGHYEGIVTIKPADPLYHCSKEIELDGISVYRVPVIEIYDFQPVSGRITEVPVKMTDGITPLVNETIDVHVRRVTETTGTLIGSGMTDEQGITRITWNITQESGEYFLQVKNHGNGLLESVTFTKAITILEKGPQILQADVTVQDSGNNLYTITAVVDFPGGKGKVYLCTGTSRERMAELQETGSFWTLHLQLPKGQHDLWLQAVDTQGIESWESLGTVTVLNDLPASSETTVFSRDGNLVNAITDTIITIIVMLPVGTVIVLKKRKKLVRN